MTTPTFNTDQLYDLVKFVKPRDDIEAAPIYELAEYLVKTIPDDPEHPLTPLLKHCAMVLSQFEEEQNPIPDVSNADLLQSFMDDFGLKQTDLPEIGAQSVVSQVLAGKRELNRRQIAALAKRFNVSPAIFF